MAYSVDPKNEMHTGMEQLTILLPMDPQNGAYQAENIPLDVIFSDVDIAIAHDKPLWHGCSSWSWKLVRYAFKCCLTSLSGMLFKFQELE
jgi:hypothetical protein